MKFNKPTLTLFCGLPGAGKTTLARQLERQAGAIRLCTDEWMADLGLDLFDEAARSKLQDRLYELCKELLAHGQDVILEDGLWSRQERDGKLADARRLSARIEMHYFDVSLNELWRRIQQRNETIGHGTIVLTRKHLEEYWPMFQPMDEMELAQFDAFVVHN